jgi:transcriptional regulator with XRE-family HTH domain
MGYMWYNRSMNSQKSKAIELRKQGGSYGDISKKLNVSKSTLSYWLRDIKINKKFKDNLSEKRLANLRMGTEALISKRKKEIENIINKSKKEVAMPLSKQTKMLMGAMIYWGEGTKKGLFEITNSDPLMIKFMTDWIKEIFNITPDRLSARLNIYENQNDLLIKKF